jgi:hypothetical protein
LARAGPGRAGPGRTIARNRERWKGPGSERRATRPLVTRITGIQVDVWLGPCYPSLRHRKGPGSERRAAWHAGNRPRGEAPAGWGGKRH